MLQIGVRNINMFARRLHIFWSHIDASVLTYTATNRPFESYEGLWIEFRLLSPRCRRELAMIYVLYKIFIISK